MEGNDFRGTEGYYQRMVHGVENLQIPEVNKKLAKEFVESCLVGMYGKKIGKVRAGRVVLCLKNLCRLLPEGKIWPDITKVDVKTLLLKVDERQSWGGWEKYVTLFQLRKFMTWLRCEYGYPEGYPGREKLMNTLPLRKYAEEVSYNIARPNKLKPFSEIPTIQEVQWLLDACETYKDKIERARDRAVISILSEVGMRIGGLGILKMSDISFDNLGARITIHDKTMIGEPIRLIKSVPHLKAWLEVHPLKNNLEAPLWVNLRGTRVNMSMDYEGMRKALRKSVRIHNELAEKKGLPKITKRIHFHAFRYHAQTRDMLDGMPVSIQCLQRGWSPTSKMPMKYARVSTQQADEWLAARYGLTEKASEIKEQVANRDIQERQPKPDIKLPGYL